MELNRSKELVIRTVLNNIQKITVLDNTVEGKKDHEYYR